MIDTQDKLIKRLAELYSDNVETSRRKNMDYASSRDPFQNFSASSVLGIKPEVGILVRMMDKLSRVSNLIYKKADVTDESILDTLSDLANYAMLLRIYIENQNDKG